MKKILYTIAAASAFALAGPASAQYADTNIEQRIQQLRADLQAGIQNGRISRSEAIPLRNQLQQINAMERQFSRNGLTRAERDQLQQRIQQLRQQVRLAVRNGDNRPGYGNDDYDYGNGRDCPPGLAKKNNGCQPPGQARRIGDRYEQNYGSEASRHGSQFRDNDRYVFRHEDGRVYQIDRRNGTIVRVYDARR